MQKPRFFLSFAQRLSGALFVGAALLASCSHDTAETVVPRTDASADATTAVGCPRSLPRIPGYPNARCGCYTVNGLGANKQAYKRAGAGPMFLASAMMETDNMNALGYANGDYKTGDSYNAGAAKQNWGMIRRAWGPYRSYTANDYRSAGNLNVNRNLDVQVYYESRRYFNDEKFFGGHRWGQKGWEGNMSQYERSNARFFQAAYEWTRARILSNPEYERNDVRFWVDLYAVRPTEPVAADAMTSQSEKDGVEGQP